MSTIVPILVITVLLIGQNRSNTNTSRASTGHQFEPTVIKYLTKLWQLTIPVIPFLFSLCNKCSKKIIEGTSIKLKLCYINEWTLKNTSTGRFPARIDALGWKVDHEWKVFYWRKESCCCRICWSRAESFLNKNLLLLPVKNREKRLKKPIWSPFLTTSRSKSQKIE